VVNKVAEGLHQHEKAVNDSCNLVLEIAYKKNVDEMRKSPSIDYKLVKNTLSWLLVLVVCIENDNQALSKLDVAGY